jgi:3-oxoacyl-[acyl-carrier protein] reductase
MAAELGVKGIRVNCVAPGMCETPLIGDISEKVQLMTARQTPLRRIADPQDIADSVVYLASDSASFITGVSLPVNGGIAIR